MTVIKEEKNQSMNCCQTVGSSKTSSKLNFNIPDYDDVSGSGNDCNHGTTSASDNSSAYEMIDNAYDLFDVNFPKREEVDIEFQNVKYTVRKFSFTDRKFVTKEILHGVSGAFRCGELTAIMGPSGSGKSTLLNVMTGYKATGVTGKVLVNGKLQQTSTESFRKLSVYIHQDDLLRPFLTVGETMIFAAHLKLGYKVKYQYKHNLIKKILLLLGLDKRYSTYTSKLSGGQKKRLAIALELISNPPVLYLDEPTTGLDSSSCIQCVSLLKRLAQQGHTVVCTIHQPSALIFEMFDKLYTVAEGNCIYQGPVKELIPFLGDLDLHCPSYHNPADYLMEVAVGEHERDITKLINAATKKYYEDSDLHQLSKVNHLINNIQDAIQASQTTNSNCGTEFQPLQLEKCLDLSYIEKNEEKKEIEMANFVEPASPIMQYILLLTRILICASRNYFLFSARIISHAIIGVLFGYLYLNVGPSATSVLGNYVYLYGTILFIVYTGKMAVVLSFPLELDILRREHFNRWYKLGPYFLSMISFEIPFQTFCACIYITISFYLTGNNNEERFRFYYFVLLGVLATLSAQAWGFFVGATLPVKLAVFIGPILAVLFSVFGFCTRYIDITPLFRWMWHLSYFRAAFHGVLNTIYGMNRGKLNCPEDINMYCHFKYPKVFLKQMMISDVSMSECISLMSIVIVVMHVLTLLALWYKLTKR